ncbi:universal stress protein [Desulfuromonas carbonis]|uniref:universal stress protein n=1 Tax=Desulfuromonas sp. DDH964 TaxID=1823759 RepID=UPI00078C6599|nr:universal stress protein [Desulfuromonas sp. DDH964]AMV70458.1 hypothetical protein DBW_0057 [Desulfuromonas sp. DDH964]
MKLKEILVYLDPTPASNDRVAAALLLARKHDARLRGLYVYEGPGQQDPAAELGRVREAFERQVAAAGVASGWVAVDLGFTKISLVEMLGYQCCFADLLVVSQPAVEKDGLAGMARLLLGAGCPVLVVPLANCPLRLGERVLVAWKAGPKASRALRDALPLLALAEQVSLVSIGSGGIGIVDESSRLRDYCNGHGLAALVEQIPRTSLDVGEDLLNLAADHAADLVVVGVHVTSRRGRLELGEVGNRLLSQMTVPMLLAN